MLRASVGAIAAAALRPVAAAAQAASALGPRASASLQTITLGTLAGSRLVELPPGVAVAGLRWRTGAPGAKPQLRVVLPHGAFGPWVSARDHGHGPDARAATADQVGDPLWIGGSRRLELRSPAPLQGVELLLVRAAEALGRAPLGGAALGAGPARPATAAALPLAQPQLTAGAGQPPIIARAAWAHGVPPPRVAPVYGEVKLGFVHHTENPNGYLADQVPAMLRAIYLFHREGNGWNDIGYNFVIDLYGRIWEARAGGIDEAVVGAQAGGYNLLSSGVAVLGSFSGTPISEAAHTALQDLLAWKLSLHGVPAQGRVTVRVNPAGASYSRYPARAHVSLPRIAGHRDADSTDCPGDVLYGQLGGIRRRVHRLSTNAVAVSLAVQPAPPAAAPAPAAGSAPPAGSAPTTTPPSGASPAAPAPAGQPGGTTPSAGPPPQLLVTAVRLDGVPLAGVPVQLQVRTVARRGLSVTHTTVAEAVTDATGRCLLTAAFAVGAAAPMWVRALFAGGPGAGAAVSPAVRLAPVAPTPQPAAATPSG